MPESRSVLAKTIDNQLWYAVLRPEMVYDWSQAEYVQASSTLSVQLVRPALTYNGIPYNPALTYNSSRYKYVPVSVTYGPPVSSASAGYSGPKRCGYHFVIDSYQPLDVHQDEVWQRRKKQIQDLKDDEQTKKYWELAGSIVSSVGLFLPFLGLTGWAFRSLGAFANIGSFVTAFADTQLFSDPLHVKLYLAEETADEVFKLLEAFSPVGSKIWGRCADAAFYIGDAQPTDDSTGTDNIPLRVPADDEMEQIWWFRRKFDPKFKKYGDDMDRISKNIAKSLLK